MPISMPIDTRDLGLCLSNLLFFPVGGALQLWDGTAQPQFSNHLPDLLAIFGLQQAVWMPQTVHFDV